jgi:hypothetical protein
MEAKMEAAINVVQERVEATERPARNKWQSKLRTTKNR